MTLLNTKIYLILINFVLVFKPLTVSPTFLEYESRVCTVWIIFLMYDKIVIYIFKFGVVYFILFHIIIFKLHWTIIYMKIYIKLCIFVYTGLLM